MKPFGSTLERPSGWVTETSTTAAGWCGKVVFKMLAESSRTPAPRPAPTKTSSPETKLRPVRMAVVSLDSGPAFGVTEVSFGGRPERSASAT